MSDSGHDGVILRDDVINYSHIPEDLDALRHQEGKPCAKPCIAPPPVAPNVGEWHELLEAFRVLGPTARQVLLMTAKRLAIGRVQYNDDFTDQRRDMIRDGIEEAADLAVYLQVQLTRMSK
jgi:hypothetical protein